jgi:hypothetical protein
VGSRWGEVSNDWWAIMANSHVDQVYRLYCDHGTHGGSPLSKAEFEAFWAALSGVERQYWENQIRSGPTAITSEVFGDLDAMDGRELDEQVRQRLSEYYRRRHALTV